MLSKILQFSTVKIDYITIVKVLVACFVLPPVVSVPYAIINYLRQEKADERSYMLLFATMACYMAVINASKYPAGDQSNYWAAYMMIPDHDLSWAMTHLYGFGEATNGKEFMNGIYNYVGYYLTAGCYPLFIWLNTVFLYMCFYFGIMKMFENKRNAKVAILAGVLCLSFYTQFFNLTIHLQRQVLAYAIVVWLYYVKATTGKTNLIGIMVAVFTHTTAIFFVPFLYLEIFYKRIDFKRLSAICLLMLGLLFVASTITNGVDVQDTNALSYSISRLQEINVDDDGGRLNMPMYLVFNIPLLILTLMNITRKGLGRYEYITYNSYIILFLFVLSMTGKPLVQYRYSFFTYGYIGLILPMFWCNNKQSLYNIYATIISLFFVVRFYLTFDQITWTYDPVWKSLLFPEFMNVLFVWYGDISRYL